MLYLSRKKGESIIINGNIAIEVVEVKRNSVKLGLVFPKDVSVLRGEVFEQVQAHNKTAGEKSASLMKELQQQGEKEAHEKDNTIS